MSDIKGMTFMNARIAQEQRLAKLVEAFKADSGQYETIETPEDDEGRKRLQRSLMNIRQPGDMPAEVLQLQDEYLKGRAKEKGIVVENTPGQNANAVAELVFALLVYAVRSFYTGKAGTELMGKKLGLLAFGNVGRNVARIAKGFGMDIYAYDAYCPASVIEPAGVHAVASQDELFQTCDVVSLHIPATPETKQSINKAVVGQMVKGGILVNTARKEVIDEEQLLQLMAERTDLKFVTDIMPDAHEKFAAFEGRYFSTPKKMGAQTAEANINAGIAAARQINAYFANGDTKFQVNK